MANLIGAIGVALLLAAFLLNLLKLLRADSATYSALNLVTAAAAFALGRTLLSPASG
jgi:hypothetical protein